jgi:hypothetical protein
MWCRDHCFGLKKGDYVSFNKDYLRRDALMRNACNFLFVYTPNIAAQAKTAAAISINSIDDRKYVFTSKSLKPQNPTNDRDRSSSKGYGDE